MNIEEKLVCLLKEKGLKISFAESITGGMLASKLINVSGASSVIEKSFVTYSNKAKNELLNVSFETIEEFDVVSKEVVNEMNMGLKNICDSDVLCSVSGYAEGYIKNIGKVCYSIFVNDKKFDNEILIEGCRNQVRRKATSLILKDIYRMVKEVQ